MSKVTGLDLKVWRVQVMDGRAFDGRYLEVPVPSHKVSRSHDAKREASTLLSYTFYVRIKCNFHSIRLDIYKYIELYICIYRVLSNKVCEV